MKQLTKPLMTVCGIAGLVVSGYLTFLSTQTSCNLNSFISCDKVLGSAYSNIWGVPVAAIGFAWFMVATVLSLISFVRNINPQFFLYWSIIGLLGIIVLIFTEVFIIEAICIFCTTAHIFGVIFLSLSVAYWRSFRKKEEKPIKDPAP